MSIFILTRDPTLDKACKTVSKALCANGFNKAKDIETQEYSLTFLQKLIYNKDKKQPLANTFLQIDNENFIAYCGSFFFDGLIGKPALKACYNAFNRYGVDWTRCNGQFTLIIKKNSETFIASDSLGATKIYHNPEKTIFSNSFQVLVDIIPQAEIDFQGCYEYAWNGNTFGEKTFISQIKSLPFEQTISLNKNCNINKRENLLEWNKPTVNLSFDENVEIQLNKLRALFKIYRNCFGDKINTALSGGYDSRLILALLLDAGVTPSLFVYGPNGDPDVETAKNIAKGEDLLLDVVDKTSLVDMSPDRFAEQIKKNWAVFDGWKLSGIFDSGVDIDDRINRSLSHLVINGGAGEIYRNFFYLPNSNISIKQLVWAFFSRYDPRACTNIFSAIGYKQNLETSLVKALGSGANWEDRGRSEMAYPLFRGRYWTARDAAINTRIGWAAFPFLEPSIIKDTWSIPFKYKEHGRLEAQMIKTLNPKLATYKSAYGYDFSNIPSVAHRLSNWTSTNRPIWLRGYLYRAKFNRKRALPFYLQDNYLEQIIDLSFPHMKRFFNMALINDPEVYNRVATMEYAVTKKGLS
ncbi:MAG: hypothetical protein HQL71_07690 [Magnetococcales bacterium]|nr:hypothetical protein [Magnetococcales bacterium]